MTAAYANERIQFGKPIGKQQALQQQMAVMAEDMVACRIAAQLGCEIVETVMGTQIGTGEARETTVPGVFTCGDAARMPHSVSLAVGDGAWAGAQLHRSLVWPAS